MATFTPRNSAPLTRQPSQPDWSRIFAGEPFSLTGFSAEELCRVTRRLEQPVPATGSATPDGRPVYPAGPWVRLTDHSGQIWWWPCEALDRSRMPQFRRAGGAA